MNTSTEKNGEDLGNLSARLGNLKVAYDTNIYGADCKQAPFPLAALLDIYYKSTTKETYWAERMHGFKLLCKWLSPITYTPPPIRENSIDYIVIRTPHELSEMEYYIGINGSNISDKDIVECSLNLARHK